MSWLLLIKKWLHLWLMRFSQMWVFFYIDLTSSLEFYNVLGNDYSPSKVFNANKLEIFAFSWPNQKSFSSFTCRQDSIQHFFFGGGGLTKGSVFLGGWVTKKNFHERIQNMFIFVLLRFYESDKRFCWGGGLRPFFPWICIVSHCL